MSNHRYSKFWWQDWRQDSALRLCSMAARGLWMELLCIAHEGTPAGHVIISGVAPTAGEIAELSGKTTEKEVVKLLAELEGKQVFSRTPEGVIFSRRMVRDTQVSEEGARHVSKRWQNGKTARHPNSGGYAGPNTLPNSPPNTHPNRDPITPPNTPYSESESEAESEADTPQTPRKRGAVCAAGFEDFWNAYPRKVGKGQARRAWATAVRGAEPATIMAGLVRCQFDSRERFRPYPATWLNGERWLDVADEFDPVLRAAGLTPEDFADGDLPPGRLLQ